MGRQSAVFLRSRGVAGPPKPAYMIHGDETCCYVCRVEETARDVDQTYGVRRKTRNALDYLQKNWPAWQRQLDEFASTPFGKAAIVVGIVLVVSTPAFW